MLQCDEVLGDTIRYRVRGGAFAEIKGEVEYREAMVDIATGQAVSQDFAIRIARALLPTRPSARDQLTIPGHANEIYRPVNVTESGDDWLFEVQRV